MLMAIVIETGYQFTHTFVASEFEFAAHIMGLRKYHNHVGSIYMFLSLEAELFLYSLQNLWRFW